MPGHAISSGARRKTGRLRPGLPSGSPRLARHLRGPRLPSHLGEERGFSPSATGGGFATVEAAPAASAEKAANAAARDTACAVALSKCSAAQSIGARGLVHARTVTAPAGAGEEHCSRTRAFLQGTRNRSWQLHAQAGPRERGRRDRGGAPGRARKMRPPVYAAQVHASRRGAFRAEFSGRSACT